MSLSLSDVLRNLEAQTPEVVKTAEEEGRLMAQGFVEELQKEAVDTDPIQVTPDHGQLPGNVNPTVQNPTSGGATGTAASAVIQSLISRVGQNGGVIQTPAGTVTQYVTEPAQPVAAEVARQQESAAAAAKTAAAYIIETLYNRHIG